MEALTPASPGSLPPVGNLIADEPFWRYPLGATARQGVAHLRVWLSAGPELAHLAVVTQTGSAVAVAESAPHVWAALARRYGSSVVLLEHHPAPQTGEGAETLDLVRIGVNGSPHWSRVWPTSEDNPRHAGLELWMAAYGHQIVSRPANWFDRGEDQGGSMRGPECHWPALPSPAWDVGVIVYCAELEAPAMRETARQWQT